MKNLYIFCFLFLIQILSFGQNVSILPTGITPAPSSAYPRLTYEQIQSLANPQQGDLAYDLTFMCLRLYTGTKWLKLLTAQADEPSSVATAENISNSIGYGSVKKDQQGNLLMAGTFMGTVNFGTGNITAINDRDVYVVKYAPNGSLLWVRVGVSLAGDAITDFEIDVNNNVIIYGFYFDNITFGSITLPYSSGFNGFLVKYDSNGNVTWAKKLISSGYPGRLETDNQGNIYATGNFGASNTFQSTPTNITLSSTGLSDGFLCKLDENGVVSWVSTINGPLVQSCVDVKVSGNDIFVLAKIQGITNVGLPNTLQTNNESEDISVLKYNLNGNISNAIVMGNSSTDTPVRLIIRGSEVIVCGDSYGFISIGGVSSGGQFNTFFVRLNSSLAILNTVILGGTSLNSVADVCYDNIGNMYVSGSFNGNISNGLKTVTSFGQSDVFVAKYSPNAIPLWIQNYGGAGFDGPISIEFSNNMINVSGIFEGTGYFGNTLISNTNRSLFKLIIVD